MKLQGNTVFITGGTSGIGRAFAEAFLEAGSRVIVCGRRADRLLKLKEKYPALVTYTCDIADDEQRRSLAGWVLQQYPEVNIFINNAGIQLVADLTRPVDITRVRAEIETNLVAPIHLASLLAPHLSAKKEAAIINISSGLAFVPIAFMPVYCATKAAIHSVTLSLRYQLRNTNVKVFEIIPPSVDTELGHERRADKSQTHGGMPIRDFITGALQAIEQDVLEAPVADAKFLREKGDTFFEELNQRIPQR